MGIVRVFERLLGVVCVTVGLLLGLFALFGFFTDKSTEGQTIAIILGGLALVILVIGLRCLRRRDGGVVTRSKTGPSTVEGVWPETAIKPPPMSQEETFAGDIEQEWEDPALIQDDKAAWRPWMRKGRLYRAINEHRYVRVAYQKKDGEEATTRILWPKKIKAGKLWADDLTPGHEPGGKCFIVERISFVELFPEEWTPLQLGR